MLATGRCLAALGPEGGLDDAEVRRLLDAGFEPVTLGRSILRWETAALHCLSLAFHGAEEGRKLTGHPMQLHLTEMQPLADRIRPKNMDEFVGQPL